MAQPLDRGVHAALASPVRRQVLDELERASIAPTAAELAAIVGLHVTTVRFHLDQLEAAGLVTRESTREPRRGRPSARYRAQPAPPDLARDQMIRALAEAASTTDDTAPLAAGQRWADLLEPGPSDPVAAIVTAFQHLGFEAIPSRGVIELRACPFREVARDHPDVVCQVHLGLAQRIAERHSVTGRSQVRLIPFAEPELCLLTL